MQSFFIVDSGLKRRKKVVSNEKAQIMSKKNEKLLLRLIISNADVVRDHTSVVLGFACETRCWNEFSLIEICNMKHST